MSKVKYPDILQEVIIQMYLLGSDLLYDYLKYIDKC